MELRHLRHFVKVAEVGSITRAASALNMSQPSLSHSIKTLEKSLEIQLFDRGGAGIGLTAGGKVFLKHALHILREAEKAVDDVASYSGRYDGTLTAGVMSGFSLSLVSRVLSRFLAQKPEISVQTQNFTSKSADFQSKLEASEWDVVLTMFNENLKLSPSIKIETITKSNSSVYCGAKHPLANKRSISPETLSQYSWATTLVSGGESFINRYFEEHDLRCVVQARCNSLNQIASLVKSAPLLCLLPDIAVVDDVARGALVRVDQDGLGTSANVVIAYSNLGIRTPAMRDFIRICAEEVRSTLKDI